MDNKNDIIIGIKDSNLTALEKYPKLFRLFKLFWLIVIVIGLSALTLLFFKDLGTWQFTFIFLGLVSSYTWVRLKGYISTKKLENQKN